MPKKIIASVKNLKVAFPSTKNKKSVIEIVRDVSFDIPEKTIVGFIGESGSGKSVTAKTLLGINNNSTTTAKEINVNGVNLLDDNNILSISKSKMSQIRGKKVAYIPQDSLTSLNPTKRVSAQIIEALVLHKVPKLKEKYYAKKQELLKEGFFASAKKLEKEYRKSISRKALFNDAVELLDTFGIPDAKKRIKSFPHEFSGGMRQRVVIAMMVACKPDIIIADEPTTALDPTVQASVLELFKKLVDEFNISIIFISHDIAVIATLCDYVNVFYAGRIVEHGPKYDVFTDPRHPYTWALLASMPDMAEKGEELFTISGQPPSFESLPPGDAFSVRNPYAMKIDFIKEPPLFKVSENHYAATWLLHPSSKPVKKPAVVEKIINEVKKDLKNAK